MKNKKLLLGAIAAVVVIGLAVSFGGNYFQGSLSNLSNISKTPTVPKNINTPQAITLPVPVLYKQPVVASLTSGVAPVADLFINSSNGKTFNLKQLHFDIAGNGVSFNQCQLYKGSTLISSAAPSSTKMNFDNFDLTVDANMHLSVNCNLSVNTAALDKSLAVTLPSRADAISWSVGNTQFNGVGNTIVKASMTWILY